MGTETAAVPLRESELESALDRGEIVAYFQPQVDTFGGGVVAVETLSRWIHPRRGLISPKDFIPLAERTGLIHRIGQLMIEEGCRCAAEWQERGHPLDVSVNVSALQLSTTEFFEAVLSTLDRLSVPASCLTLEITESQAIAEMGVVRAQFDRMRSMGIGISIDDFGTGHSSIERALSLAATELKIDQSLIQTDSDSTRALVAAVVLLVQARGIRVIAEGVETASHLAFARELGCERVQGFLLASPTPSAQLDFTNRRAGWVPLTNP